MGRRLMFGVCGALLAVGTAACGGGGASAGAPATHEAKVEAAGTTRAQKCTKTVLAAVADKLWVDSGQVTDDSESFDRNQRGRDFAAAYLGTPEWDIFMRADRDGVTAINGGATVTQGIAKSS
ncbi:hypothetical protein [Streptomyces spiralis]|uniref:hypothetical protein n=1 Tax=Streptomyces spiralis TaxID=66376 RepID=UPI0033C677E9